MRIVIPAPTRTSQYKAGRAFGAALVGMSLCDEVEYENKEGKGGLVGLAYFTEKYGSDTDAFFIGDTTLVGALALQKRAADLSKVQALARLMSDTLVAGLTLKGCRDFYWMAGPDLSSFIDLDVKTVQVMMQLLKLKA